MKEVAQRVAKGCDTYLQGVTRGDIRALYRELNRVSYESCAGI